MHADAGDQGHTNLDSDEDHRARRQPGDRRRDRPAPEPRAGTRAHALLQISLPHLLHPFAANAGLVASGPFNLGQVDDFRVPDVGYHRTKPLGVWHATAAIVVEIVSPDDETYAKFDFYLAHGVEEIIVVDPEERSVRGFLRTGTAFSDSGKSILLGVDAAYIASEIDWP